MGYSSDNASVMVGKRNSVLSRIKEKTNDRVYDVGCLSHCAHLCAAKMVKALSEPVEDLLVDVYYHFEHR